MSDTVTNDHWLETYKSLINISIESFKFSALINGGAAVALIAYLGHIAGNDAAMPDMRCPMAAFLAGLVLCGFSMLAAYITQLKLLREISSADKPAFHHGWLLGSAIFLFACSLIAFGIGGWQAVIRFQ